MTRHLFSLVLATTAVCAAGVPAAAQARSVTPPSPKLEVPNASRPPSGMCRIWIDKVPAGQQPAPTDCASAIRNRPPNGRVIFSEQRRPDDRGKLDRGKIDRASTERGSPDAAGRAADSARGRRGDPPKGRKPPPHDPA